MAEHLKLEPTGSVVEEQEEELDFSGRPSWAANSRQSEEGEERTLSRRRSLECSAIEVKIVSTELTDGHTMYVMQVSSGAKRWTVYRRFKDFDFLDKQLRKLFPNLKIPQLPPKRYFGSSNEAEFVESRRQQLEAYLNTLVGLQSIWSRNDLALFLNNDANSMMFIWNFEKMRRLQDMLSTMNVEKETETAKLNTDLSGAKDQVTQLQDKLSRMEMLFLQQATGVAAEELPPHAIRTLSGINNSLSYQLASELTEDSISLYHAKASETHPKKLDDEEIHRQNVIEDAVEAQVTSGEVLSPDQVKRVLSMTREPETTTLDLKSRSPEDVKQVAMSIQLQEAININNKIFDENFEIGAATNRIISRTSEMDLSRMLTPRKTSPVTVSPAEHLVYDHQPGVASAPWVPLLLKQVDDLVAGLTPTQASLVSRHKVFQYVRGMVSSTLGVQLFPVGSFVSHTFLPEGDLDTTAFVLKNDDDSWFVKVNEALCMSAFNQIPAGSSKSSSFDTVPPSEAGSGSGAVIINNVSFVNGDIKMIKSMIDNISVDISVNQLNALYAQTLLERVDAHVKQDHLFKRSVLLTKAWCLYDSPRHTHGAGSLAGGKEGKLTAWAVVVMLLWVFQSEGKSISHPIQALGHFLRIYSTFNWDLHALTVKGPVSAVDLSPLSGGGMKNDEYFPADLLNGLAEVCEETRRLICLPNQGGISNTASGQSASSTAAASSAEDAAAAATVAASASGSTDAAAPTTGGVPVPPAIEIPPAEASSAPATPAAAATPSSHSLRDSNPKNAVVVNQWVARSAFPEADYTHIQGLINIMDPVVPTMNLARSVDAHGFDAIVCSIQEGYKAFQTFCSVFSKVASNSGTSNNNHNEGGSSSSGAEEELVSATKLFLLNTVNKVFSLNQVVARTVAAPSSIATVSTAAASAHDWLAAQLNELEFSLHYGELVLGGKVHQDTLIQLIVQILIQKGQMPVGEIGKNLQLITGCENLSRRLKEQFQGLKKSIELSGSTRLKVGTEHPFNPIVALDGTEEPISNEPIPAFNHVGFVFTPLVVTLSAANVKEATTKSSKQSFRRAAPYYIEHSNNPRSFDSMSVNTASSHRSSVNSYYDQGGAYGSGGGGYKKQSGVGGPMQGGGGGYGGQGGSPRNRGGGGGGGNAGLHNPTSPGRYQSMGHPSMGGVGGYRGPPPPQHSQLHMQLQQPPQMQPQMQMPQQQQHSPPGQQPQQCMPLSSGMMHAMDVNGNPLVFAQQPDGSMSYVPASSFGSYGSSPSIQTMNAYQQQHHQQHMAFLQQQQMYQNYAISMGASLGSSYGASPQMSYMHYAEQQNGSYHQQLAQHQAMLQQQHLQQQQHSAQQQQQQQQHQQHP